MVPDPGRSNALASASSCVEKNRFPDCRSSVATLCKIALAGYEATQLAEVLRCAHMISAEPRWLVPSKLSNPCSSFESRKNWGNVFESDFVVVK
jgi:hypothetical protein